MKTLIHLSVLVLPTTLLGQPYCPEEHTVTIGGKIVSAWVVAVDQEPVDLLQARFRTYVRKRFRIYVRRHAHDSELLVASRAVMPTITYVSGSLLARVYCAGDTTMLAVAYRPSSGMPFNTGNCPQDMQNLWQFTRDFVRYYKVRQIKDQIAEEQYWRREWEESCERDEQQIKKLNRKIERASRRIARTEGKTRKKWQAREAQLRGQIANVRELKAVKLREIYRSYATVHNLKEGLIRVQARFDEPINYEWEAPT
jgi:hypothetical protein